jgi:hypothetical protein
MCLDVLLAELARVKAQVTAVSPLEGPGQIQATGGQLCSLRRLTLCIVPRLNAVLSLPAPSFGALDPRDSKGKQWLSLNLML